MLKRARDTVVRYSCECCGRTGYRCQMPGVLCPDCITELLRDRQNGLASEAPAHGEPKPDVERPERGLPDKR